MARQTNTNASLVPERLRNALARAEDGPVFPAALLAVHTLDVVRTTPAFAALEDKAGPEAALRLAVTFATEASTKEFAEKQEATPARAAAVRIAFTNEVIARSPDALYDMSAVLARAEKMWGDLGPERQKQITSNPGAILAALDGAAQNRRPLGSASGGTISYSDNAAAKGAFERDKFGMTDIDRVKRVMDGDEPASVRSSSRDFRQMDNPDTAVRSTTRSNFSSSMFAREAGLDWSTFDYLRKSSENFSGSNILHAGIDAKALGLNKDRDAVADLAVLDKYDPEGRQQRKQSDEAFDRWLKAKHKEIEEWNQKLAATPEGPERDKVLQGYDEFIEQGAQETGANDYDKRLKQRGVPQKVIDARKRTKQRLLKKAKVDRAVVQKFGGENAFAKLDAVASAGGKPSTDAANRADQRRVIFLMWVGRTRLHPAILRMNRPR